MKKTSLVTLLLFICVFTQAQQNASRFSIINNGTKYSAELVNKAFSGANLCGLFYETKNNDIVFDDGTIVRLFSRKEQPVKAAVFQECSNPDNTVFPKIIWSIDPSGILVKSYKALPKHKAKSN